MACGSWVRFESIVLEGGVRTKRTHNTYKCNFCQERFKAYKKLKLHKQDVHAYD